MHPNTRTLRLAPGCSSLHGRVPRGDEAGQPWTNPPPGVALGGPGSTGVSPWPEPDSVERRSRCARRRAQEGICRPLPAAGTRPDASRCSPRQAARRLVDGFLARKGRGGEFHPVARARADQAPAPLARKRSHDTPHPPVEDERRGLLTNGAVNAIRGDSDRHRRGVMIGISSDPRRVRLACGVPVLACSGDEGCRALVDRLDAGQQNAGIRTARGQLG